MNMFWKIVKKFPCCVGVFLIAFLTMTARVQGNIATLTERTLINLASGIAVVTITLYAVLYLTGTLNPGDKPIIDFMEIGKKLLKGKSENQDH